MKTPDLGLSVEGFKSGSEHIFLLPGGKTIRLFEVPGVAEQTLVGSRKKDIELLTSVSFIGVQDNFINTDFVLTNQRWRATNGTNDDGQSVLRHDVMVMFFPADDLKHKVVKIAPLLHRSTPDPEFQNIIGFEPIL